MKFVMATPLSDPQSNWIQTAVEIDRIGFEAKEGMVPWALAPVAVKELVDTACKLHASANGSTISLFEGDMLGQKRFAVSIYPERSVSIATALTWRNISAFALLNLDLLGKPSHAFGSWFDRSCSRHVLDVVLCVPSRRTAIELGRLFGQTSVYDLAAQRAIVIRHSSGGYCRSPVSKRLV